MRTPAAAFLPLLAPCGAVELAEPGEPIDPPGPGEAKVVVLRPADRNAARSYAFYDGMELAGFLQSGSAIEYLCGPGERLLYLRGVTDAAVRADLEPGKTYHLRVASEPLWLRLRLTLLPAAPDEELAACRLLRTVPEAADGYVEEHREAVSERLAYYAGEGRPECALLRKEDGR